MSKKHRLEHRAERSKRGGEKPRVSKKERVASRTRKSVLWVLALATALGGGVWMVKGGSDPTEKQTSAVGTSAPGKQEAIQAIRQPEWASKIELPRVDFDKLGIIEEGEIYDRFLPPNADRKLLPGFYAEFDSLKGKLLHDLKDSDNLSEHRFLAERFFEELNRAFKALTHGDSTSKIQINANAITHSLVPHKNYVQIDIRNNEIFWFYFYDVIGIQTIDLGLSNDVIKVPIVSIGDGQKIFQSTPDNPSFGSFYSKSGKYIVTSKSLVSENINIQIKAWHEAGLFDGVEASPQLLKDEMKRSLAHESMHAYLAKMAGKLGKDDFTGGIGAKGEISMGSYSLNERDYSWAKFYQLHELGACGSGLAHSRGSALNEGIRIARVTGDESAYALAAQILLRELMFSSNIDSSLKGKAVGMGRNGRMIYYDYYKLFELMRQIPEDELHRIGERMAKLALYLAAE